MDGGPLDGAVVQRVDVGPLVALLRVRLPGATRWVIAASGRRGGVGVVADKPWRGAGLPGGTAPEGEKMRLRARLEGGRLSGLSARGVLVVQGEVRWLLEAPAADGARVSLRDGAEGGGEPATEEALAETGARLAEQLFEGAVSARRAALSRALGRAEARIARRIEAVRGDLDRIAEADGLAARAALFVAEAARAPRGAARLVVTDWSTGEPLPVEIALDPSRSAREQVDAAFKRARRLKQGAAVAGRRLAEAEATAAALAAVAARLPDASVEALEPLAQEARAAAPRDFALAEGAGGGAGRKETRQAPSRPFRELRAGDGGRILVGKGAAHNDALTFHEARPHDLWLHAKGRTGAHVIVPLEKGASCPPERLIDAAHLAAHFSDAREEGVVEIQHTPRRYLRKPKGSAPGFVIVDREKVLVLRVERARTARLLATEGG